MVHFPTYMIVYIDVGFVGFKNKKQKQNISPVYHKAKPANTAFEPLSIHNWLFNWFSSNMVNATRDKYVKNK